MRIDKDNIKIILILLVVCLGIGYSYLNTELNINGTANINSANWSVYWNNVQVESGSVSAPTPTIDSDKTTVSYTVTLEKPGDYYEFTVDAVNAGTIDAMIETIDSKLNGVTMEEAPAYLDYGISYADNTPLEYNQELLHDSTETYKVHIGYADYIEADELPATNQTLNLSFTVTYRQANDEAIPIEHIITGTRYASNFYIFESFGIGDEVPTDLTLYSSAEEALAALRLATGDDDINFYLRYVISEGIIEESYLDFIITPEMALANPGMTAGTYELRGGVYSQEVYEENSAILVSAFGSSNCEINSDHVNCSVPGMDAFSAVHGTSYTRDDYWYCMASNYSYCDEGWPIF